MRVEAVLFDVGGTLLSLDHGFMAARAAEFGVVLGVEAVLRGEAEARRQIDRRARAAGALHDTDADRRAAYFEWTLRAAGAAPDTARCIARAVDEAHLDDNLWRVVIDGALDTLEALRVRGLRTAAVSNSDGRIEAMLARAGLRHALDFVVDSQLEGVEKPDPELFQRALQRMGIAPAAAIYVGDIYSIDVVGARGAGLGAVLLDRTGAYRDHDCDVIGGLPDLLELVP